MISDNFKLFFLKNYDHFYRKVFCCFFFKSTSCVRLLWSLTSTHFWAKKEAIKWKLGKRRALWFSNLWHRCLSNSWFSFSFLFPFPLFTSLHPFEPTNVAEEWSPVALFGVLVTPVGFWVWPPRRYTDSSMLEAPNLGYSRSLKVYAKIYLCVYFSGKRIGPWVSSDFQMILWPGKTFRIWI